MKRNCTSEILVAAFLFLVIGFSCLSVCAKPMPLPSMDEAVNSSMVIVCDYLGFDRKAKADYFGGVTAFYKVKEIAVDNCAKTPLTKSLIAGSKVKVRYAFDDGSACLAPTGWKFEPGKMPGSGSRWILILTPANDGAEYTTYRGSFGRIPYSLAKLSAIKGLAKSSTK